jgi:hypothetical protein
MVEQKTARKNLLLSSQISTHNLILIFVEINAERCPTAVYNLLTLPRRVHFDGQLLYLN